MHELMVPTANDNSWDFNALFRAFAAIPAQELDVVFDFSHCRFLRQNAVAFLGGAVRVLQRQGRTVRFRLDTLRSDVRANLAQNGFLATLGFADQPWTGNSIPFREHTSEDKEDIVRYLKEFWLGRGWVRISPMLRDAIVGTVWEIYTNAFEHSRSAVGVFSCGQHFPRLDVLSLAVADFGVGIPRNVRDFTRSAGMPASNALSWAVQRGTTTKPGTGRGMGLDLLLAFVRLNGGRLEIYSGDGLVRITSSGTHFEDRAEAMPGTVVNITFKCDERLYRLAAEANAGPLF